ATACSYGVATGTCYCRLRPPSFVKPESNVTLGSVWSSIQRPHTGSSFEWRTDTTWHWNTSKQGEACGEYSRTVFQEDARFPLQFSLLPPPPAVPMDAMAASSTRF
ncbi:unnamed protein product, partial [Ectocarpus sp. 12 AP-2014]